MLNKVKVRERRLVLSTLLLTGELQFDLVSLLVGFSVIGQYWSGLQPPRGSF